MTATTQTLADKYRRAGIERVEVIDNYVPRARPRHGRSGGNGKVVVGWVAGLEHRADAKRLRIPQALRSLLAANESVHVESIGVDLGLTERYQHDSFVRFRKLPDRVASFDVGVAPLADMSFNQTRSAIKVKEYAAAGVPWLASPVGPYAELGEDQGGRLVRDDEWFDALADLVAQPRDRRRLGRKGRSWVKRQLLKAEIGRWEAVFQAALETYARNHPALAQLRA